MVSIYVLDKLIKTRLKERERQEKGEDPLADDLEELYQLVKAKLPKAYWSHRAVFSKAVIDELALY